MEGEILQLSAKNNFGIEPGSLEDRAVGCFLGLAVGDALGAPVEFMSPGSFEQVTGYRAGGPFNLNAGEWTDDTSMALALADALLVSPMLKSPDVVVRRWRAWYEEGWYSHNNRCFDIGNQTSAALIRWKTQGKGPKSTDSAGNGGIMRLAPVAVRHYGHQVRAMRVARAQSDLTHNNLVCGDFAARLAKVLCAAIVHGRAGANDHLPVNLDRSDVRSTGYVKDTFGVATWAVLNSDTFFEAVLLAVNLGGDADTAGAVTGQIAGACYGLSGIPVHWVEQLAWRDWIIDLGRRLFKEANTGS
jgi:ADP-ribosyl-[dinitrogen reductase] hydrolase